MIRISYLEDRTKRNVKDIKKELLEIQVMQEEWLKTNTPTKCDDAYLDNPYKQSYKQSNSHAGD